MTQKKLMVTVTEEQANALKLYAATWGTTISAVVREAALQHMYSHSACCGKVSSVLSSIEVELDKRRFKECYGFPCRACQHETACRTGLYGGHWVIKERYVQYLSEENQAIIKEQRADWETLCAHKYKTQAIHQDQEQKDAH